MASEEEVQALSRVSQRAAKVQSLYPNSHSHQEVMVSELIMNLSQYTSWVERVLYSFYGSMVVAYYLLSRLF